VTGKNLLLTASVVTSGRIQAGAGVLTTIVPHLSLSINLTIVQTASCKQILILNLITNINSNIKRQTLQLQQ
jgi:hypothetical protein